jgi:hypothetical protein
LVVSNPGIKFGRPIENSLHYSRVTEKLLTFKGIAQGVMSGINRQAFKHSTILSNFYIFLKSPSPLTAKNDLERLNSSPWGKFGHVAFGVKISITLCNEF